jgi:hypothetical protein
MATTASFTVPTIAFGLPGSVAFGQADQPLKSYHVASLRDEMEEPVVGFSRDGRLVVCDGARAVVFRESTGTRRLLEFDVGMGPLKAITRAAALHEIAFFGASGEVRVYSLGAS